MHTRSCATSDPAGIQPAFWVDPTYHEDWLAVKRMLDTNSNAMHNKVDSITSMQCQCSLWYVLPWLRISARHWPYTFHWPCRCTEPCTTAWQDPSELALKCEFSVALGMRDVTFSFCPLRYCSSCTAPSCSETINSPCMHTQYFASQLCSGASLL